MATSRLKKRVEYLYDRFITDTATPEEIREFWDLMEDRGNVDFIKEKVNGLYDTQPGKNEQRNWDGVFNRILLAGSEKKESSQRWWLAAAAVILIAVSFTIFYFSQTKPINTIIAIQKTDSIKKDVAAPAQVHATLTLSDGSKIFLDSTGTGTFARQSNVKVSKTGNGQIMYDPQKSPVAQQVVYNTLTNPRGSRVLSIILSDGSKIWLNAESTVRFPVAFTGGERKIIVTGEIYVEVAHDANKKFLVESHGITTEAIGTHFNVSSYPGEDVTAITLLEGKVRVASHRDSILLSPGQQGLSANNGSLQLNKEVNVDAVIAWKNQMFDFNDTNIKNIMKEVERWYDVKVEYDGNFDGLNFDGVLSRQKNVSELLKRLEATQTVKFAITNRTIRVTRIK